MPHFELLESIKPYALLLIKLLAHLAKVEKLIQLLRKLFSKEIWARISVSLHMAQKALLQALIPSTPGPRTVLALKILLCAGCYVLAIAWVAFFLADVALVFNATGTPWKFFVAAAVLLMVAWGGWWMFAQAESLRMSMRENRGELLALRGRP